MKVVADANIPYLSDALRGVGDVVAVPSKEITSALIKDAELLFTRSTIQINEALLSGSRVRFVATATIGTDHVDFAYLQKNNIAFSAAPGSNSNSVAEWFVNSLLTIIGVLVMMFWVSPLLALVALVTVPVSFLVARSLAQCGAAMASLRFLKKPA